MCKIDFDSLFSAQANSFFLRSSQITTLQPILLRALLKVQFSRHILWGRIVPYRLHVLVLGPWREDVVIAWQYALFGRGMVALRLP